MGWLPRGYAACDSCGKQKLCIGDRKLSIQMLRASGWHHDEGVTIGGKRYEAILCRECVKQEHKRSRDNSVIEQDGLFDAEEYRKIESGPGSASR